MLKNFLQNAKRWLPGTLISLALIAIILNAVDLPKTITALQNANVLYLLAGALISLAWVFMRGLVWRTLLQNRVSYRDTFLSLCEGYLMNNFLPFRLGELGRAFLISEKSELDFAEVLPTIVVERIFDLIIAAALLIGAVPYIAKAKETAKIGYLIGGAVLLIIILLYTLAHKQDWAISAFKRISKGFPKVQEVGEGIMKSLLAGLSVFTNGALFLRFLLWILLNWLLAIAQFTLIILAFFPQATLIWGVFGLGATAFGNAVPSLPGAIGTLEAALGGALNLLSGGDMSTALAVALVVRLYNYAFTGIVGIYGFNTEGETLAGIYQKIKDIRKS